MSKTNYKRLGDYIREVDVRNRDLKVTKLYGVNLQKEFMPSVANIIGTDLSKYKIVSYNQFGCKLMSVERDHKLPISLMKESQPAIMSSAYFVFEVIDENVLNPDYLFMQIKRPEFDRRLWFSTGGDVRGGATWDNLCDMPIIVPSIDQQRKIVAEYNAIQQRIKLNEQQIVKLEETAQAIYRKMFVDGIDKNNLPEGWRMGTLGEIANILDYKRKPLSAEQRALIKGEYPYFGAMSIIDYINDYIFDGVYLLFAEDGVNVVDENGHPNLQYVYGKFWLNNHAHIMQGNDIISTEYLYLALKQSIVTDLVTGAAQPKINQENMVTIPIIVPYQGVMEQFNRVIKYLFDSKKSREIENFKLKEIQSLLLVKMGQQ